MKLWIPISLVIIFVVGGIGIFLMNPLNITPTNIEKPQFDIEKDAVIENKKTEIYCAKEGGTSYYQTGYYLGCAYQTSDSGKSCIDSDECEGHCNPVHIERMTDEYPFNFQCENPTIKYGASCWENIGVCADDTRFNNCGIEFVNDTIKGVNCID